MSRPKAEPETTWATVRGGMLPRMLEVELCGICNANPPCAMCVRNETPDLARAFISEQTLDGLDALFSDVSEVIVQGVGEPLFQLDKLCSAFERIPATAQISINTNGTMMTPKAIERLVGLKVSTVVVSVDGATEETYTRIRRRPLLAKVIRGIEGLVAAKKAAGSRVPRVMMSMTLMRENLHEASALVQLAARVGADGVYFNPLNDSDLDYQFDAGPFKFSYLQQRLDPESEEVIAAVQAAAELAAGLGLRFDADRLAVRKAVAEPFGGQTGKLENRYFCPKPWDSCAVDIVGNVRACHRMKSHEAILGNLAQTSLAEIWRGEKLERIRADIARGVMPQECGCVDLRHPRPELTMPFAAAIRLDGATPSADGQQVRYRLTLTNEGSEVWRSGVGLTERVLIGCQTNPVRDRRTDSVAPTVLLRELPRDLGPGETVQVDWELACGELQPGVHIFRFDLMHRNGGWFDPCGQSRRVSVFLTRDAQGSVAVSTSRSPGAGR